MEKVIELIKKAKAAVILPHENADGDAVGSCLAMREALRSIGIAAEIYAEEQLEPSLRFIDDGIKVYSGQSIACDTAIVLDCGDERRLGASVARRDLRVRRERRKFDPHSRLAGRVPSVDLVRKELACRICETEIAAAGDAEV